jgi:hypothetical protein
MQTRFLFVVFLLSAFPVSAAERIVKAGEDFKAVLSAAACGDVIKAEAGAPFETGDFLLPARSCLSNPITITSTAMLPNRRVTLADYSLLAVLRASVNATVIAAEAGANGWKFDGVAFISSPTWATGETFGIHDACGLTLDRVLMVSPVTGHKRAIRANGGCGSPGTGITLTRSHIEGYCSTGVESQGYIAWDGPGPHTLTDNFIEACSINVMFGGADNRSAAHTPADILVEGNTLFKRPEWQQDAGARVIKNFFELKNAKRVVVRGNTMVNNYPGGQAGDGIVFTPRNQSGGNPWATVEDVLFEQNDIRNSYGCVQIIGYDYTHPSQQLTRVMIRGNRFDCTQSYFVRISGEAGAVTVTSNTARNVGTLLLLPTGDVWKAGEARRAATFAVDSLTVTNNVGSYGHYGVHGDLCSGGKATECLAKMVKTPTAWAGNVIAMTPDPGMPGSPVRPAPVSTFPIGTTFVSSVSALDAMLATDGQVLAGSAIAGKGTGGSDPGWTGLGVVMPPPTPVPSPEPCQYRYVLSKAIPFPGIAASATVCATFSVQHLGGTDYDKSQFEHTLRNDGWTFPAPVVVGTTPPPPVPSTGLTVSIKSQAVATCRVTLTANPPDALGGWRVQFKRGTVNFGTADASPPYERSSTVAAGSYQVSGVWTKSGQATQTTAALAVGCK